MPYPSKKIEGLTFHHVALLVENMEEALVAYADLFGQDSISEIYTVTAQKVKVCFVKNGPDTYIELVAPMGDDAPVLGLLKKKHSYYHIGYKVRGIQEAVNKLEQMNYKAMAYYNSEAFGGHTCAFLFTPGGHLIELIEE